SLAVLSRRPVEIEPFMAAQLAAVGRWDPAPAVEAIRDRRYDLIQRTAFIIAPPGEDPIRQRLRDRTVPAIDLAIEDAYAPGILPSFVREAGRNRYEEFSIWFPKPEDDEPRGADPPPSDRRG
ncbi:MAG: hypothetical protein JXP34_24295, partial [Planctomycetes bacterium]|nr:hypothetical protein [Planctomycetota bacterium]